jgi:hypothetical protein
MSDNQQSSWRHVYLNLYQQKSTERLTQAVMAAEAAIFARMQELAEASNHTEEHDQLKEATAELLAIKTQKLGWPQP